MTKGRDNIAITFKKAVESARRRWYPRGNVIEVSDDLLPEVGGDTFDTLREKIKKAGKKPAKK